MREVARGRSPWDGRTDGRLGQFLLTCGGAMWWSAGRGDAAGSCARPRKCSGWMESKGGEEWTENLGSETRASKLSAMAAPWAELARKKGGEGKMTRTSNRERCDCRGSRSVVAPKRRCVQRKRIRRFVLGARAAVVASRDDGERCLFVKPHR